MATSQLRRGDCVAGIVRGAGVSTALATAPHTSFCDWRDSSGGSRVVLFRPVQIAQARERSAIAAADEYGRARTKVAEPVSSLGEQTSF